MPKNTPSRIIDNRQARAVAFLGGGGTVGGTTDHGTLSGLADDDHAQYLRTDGTRTLTGNLAVAASVTIDGIDISAHAADVNAHHKQAHVITGTDHTVTGSQYQIVGLTSANTLGLLTAASSPTANQVVKTDGSSAVTLVDATVTSDLFMTGTLDFGTDTIYEDATYLQVTGSKALRFAQNIGNANWTLYNAGGYTTTGSISITGAAGDLTVGSNVLFVDNSGNNVGIACVPDSQFALDVAGPARAQYFIGPHALQLKDATMILHFDGAAPYKTNYNGIMLGHKGQPATGAGGLVFRPGKFGKAMQIAAAATNLVTRPSIESGTVGSTPTGWSMSGAGTFVKSADVSFAGTYSGKLTLSSQAGYPTHDLASSINIANAYTVSAWVWVDTYTSGTLTMSLQRTDTFAELATVTIDTAAAKRKSWQRVAATYAGGGSGTRAARVKFEAASAATMVVYIDAVQVEQSAYCTPYCDGTLNPTGGTAHAWTGTAHASTSTRTAAELYYGIANVDPREGTVSAWVWVEGFYNNNRLFHFRNDDGSFDYYLASTGGAIFRYNSVATGAGTLTARTWHHVAVTWSLESGYAYTYLDGEQIGASAITGPTLVDATLMSIGQKWGGNQLNGMIDDFTIMATAASDDEVRAIYESNAPVFAESSTVSWVATPGGLVWADAEGLWMRDSTANPVLGVYGGDATKSWGGFTMSPGDLLIGNNAVGSSAILWDQSAGTFGFYGAGNATAQVLINTDGTLYAGTAGAQRVQLSSAELAGYNSSNAKQWYGSTTDGKLYAGGGKTWLGSSGISILAPASADMSTDYYIAWPTQGNLTTLSGYINCSFAGTSGSPDGQMIIAVNKAGTANRVSFDTTLVSVGGNLDAVGTVRGSTIYADGDAGGVASTTSLTNGVNTTMGAGLGSIHLNGSTNRNHDGWIKIYVGATACWLPYWVTIS